MTQQPQRQMLLTIGLIIVIGIVGYYVMNAPDQRSAGQKIGDAIDQLGDRTPGEKLGDAVKNAGDDLKKSTN